MGGRRRPGYGGRRPARHAAVLHAKRAAFDLDVGVGSTRNGPEPAAPRVRIDDARLVSESIGFGVDTRQRGNVAVEGHTDLRAEARPETEGVFDGIGTAARQGEIAEIRVRFLEVRDRRNDARLQ